MTNQELRDYARSWWLPQLLWICAILSPAIALVLTWSGGHPRVFVAHVNGALVLLAFRWLIQLPQQPYRAELDERRRQLEQRWEAEQLGPAQQLRAPEPVEQRGAVEPQQR